MAICAKVSWDPKWLSSETTQIPEFPGKCGIALESRILGGRLGYFLLFGSWGQKREEASEGNGAFGARAQGLAYVWL